jgi:hypothetical protein
MRAMMARPMPNPPPSERWPAAPVIAPPPAGQQHAPALGVLHRVGEQVLQDPPQHQRI